MNPQRRRIVLGRALAAFAVLLGAAPSVAFETAQVAGEPVLLEVTEALSVVYNADNRNTRRADVASQADDDWGMLYNRLNLNGSWAEWRAGLRLDSALFYTSRSPNDISMSLLDIERQGREQAAYTQADAAFFAQKFFQAGDELTDRFVSWTYPAKYNVTYATPDIEATAGDFYAQFGQGLVLSVRKQDELANDTTIRGLRLTGRLKDDDLRLQMTALGGVLNPLRVDEASGRNLHVTGDVLDGVTRITEAAMPHGVPSDFVPDPLPNYAPDRVIGLEFGAKLPFAGLGLRGVRLGRGCLEGDAGCVPLGTDRVRSARTIDNAGVSLELPKLGETTAAYVEYAHQRLGDFPQENQPNTSGDAVYARLSWVYRPVALTFEGKHYRAFYPLRAGIDVNRAREFTTVQYSAPPTTQPIWADTEFEEFNSCVTGGRARVDLELSRRQSLYAWAGHYYTWGERAPAGRCQTTDENLNRVWDFAQGAELVSDDRMSKGNVMVGTRFDTTDEPIADLNGDETTVFYRELYLRHDVVVGLGGEQALQFQAWHRRRRQTLGGPETPWLQGQTTTGFFWDRHWSFAFGFEYDENPAFPTLYINGQVRYDFDLGNVALFVGQRQGGLRCVGGICRVFPPFEGARLDATLRF